MNVKSPIVIVEGTSGIPKNGRAVACPSRFLEVEQIAAALPAKISNLANTPPISNGQDEAQLRVLHLLEAYRGLSLHEMAARPGISLDKTNCMSAGAGGTRRG